jgi:hypothetical protein
MVKITVYIKDFGNVQITADEEFEQTKQRATAAMNDKKVRCIALDSPEQFIIVPKENVILYKVEEGK